MSCGRRLISPTLTSLVAHIIVAVRVTLTILPNDAMTGDGIELLDEQIERMKGGGTLSENEVKILCDRVSSVFKT